MSTVAAGLIKGSCHPSSHGGVGGHQRNLNFCSPGSWQLLGTNHLRPLSITATQSSSSTASTRAAFAFTALGGSLLNLGGHSIVAGSSSMSVDVATKRALESPPPQKPVYGTPEDFSRAIEERVICERCGDDRTGLVEGAWVFAEYSSFWYAHPSLPFEMSDDDGCGAQGSRIAMWCTRL